MTNSIAHQPGNHDWYSFLADVPLKNEAPMFTQELWESWATLETNNYKTENDKRKYVKKGYTHFDHRFWFPEKQNELKSILQGGLKVYKKTVKRTESWAFSPFLKMLINTPRYRYQDSEVGYNLETKIRPICFASHLDSLIFGFYSHCITKKYERYIKQHQFDECVLAYRSDLGLSNIQFAKEVFHQVKSRGECTSIALDIKGYFDNIDHSILKDKWKKVLQVYELPDDQFKIFKALTRYSYVSKNSLYRTFSGKTKRDKKRPNTLLDLIDREKDHEKYDLLREKKLIVTNKAINKDTGNPIGIPQGSAMSALLSNIYLIDYDEVMYAKAKAEGFIYRRYCDDILIICDTEKATKLQNFAIEKIKTDYHLTIQSKKVETIDFHFNSKNIIRAFKRDKNNLDVPVETDVKNEQKFYKSLQYLGFEFNGVDIFIRSSSLSRYFRKMKARVVKSVSMAYSPKGNSDKVFQRQIFERYSHLGERNFISYAKKAASEKYKNAKGEWKEGMNSPAITKQIAKHINLIENTLSKKNEQRINYKASRKKPVTRKRI